MSAPFKIGAGAGAISSFPISHISLFEHHQKNKCSRTFLQRNLRAVLHTLTMGSKISKLSSPFSGAKHRPPPDVSDDEDEDPQPPTKRRRLNKFDEAPIGAVSEDEAGFRKPFGHVTNESYRQLFRPRPGPVQPSDFYGKARPMSVPAKRPFVDITTTRENSPGQAILPKKPADFSKSLRVEISGIGPTLNEDHLRLAIKKPFQKIKCNLLVSIFGRKNDAEGFVERCRRSKICTLHVTLENGVMKREFDEPQSFIFLPHEFYMNRKPRTYTDDGDVIEDEFDCSYGFVDRYSLQAIIEPVGYHKAWPPVDVPVADEANEDQKGFAVSKAVEDKEASWIDVSLLAETKTLMNAGRQNQTPDLKVCFGTKTQLLNAFLGVQIFWALPSHLSAVTAKTVKSESPVEVPATLKDIPPASPVPCKAEELSIPDSPAGHSRRARTTVGTYNLKTLSAQAQGRSPRKRKQRENNVSAENSGVTVTYTFGSMEAAELGIQRESKVSGLACPFCRCPNKSVSLLTFHLQNSHFSYKFQLRRSQPRVQYFATVVRTRPIELARTLQFTKPTTIFELEKFLNGDDSWIKSRYGPRHHALPEHLRIEEGQESSLSSSSRGSRVSSPNTSDNTDDMMDLEFRLKAFSATLPVRSAKRLYVPKTAKPLYDTITKRVLEPGEELPNSDDEKEESWLMLKHRDAINDYTDLTDEEKDYINRWNPFIMEEHLTSERYLGHSLHRYVLTNRMWLAETPERIREFQKHCQSFKLHGIITAETRSECMKIIREAWQEKQSQEDEGDEKGKKLEEQSEKRDVEMIGNDEIGGNEDMKEETPKLRGAMSCICLEHADRAGRVVCAGSYASVSFLINP
jgi:hypothetical protein